MGNSDKEKDIAALVSLIDDPDQSIFQQVSEKLMLFGPDAIPFLENAWDSYFEPGIQTRIENLIHDIQFENICFELNNWYLFNSNNLLKGALIINRYQYPDLDEQLINQQIDKIRKEIWLELNERLTALEQIKVFNYIFYDLNGFSGNVKNYHSPSNSYLNQVFESKKGNPLSLGILYSLIAQNLGLPVYGVNLPEHFVLAYTQTSKTLIQGNETNNDVLFYINVFNKGAIFSGKEIQQFITDLKLSPDPAFYMPCSNITIIRRMLNNLINAYQKAKLPAKAQEIKKLADIIREKN